jgi:hypothetical protein
MKIIVEVKMKKKVLIALLLVLSVTLVSGCEKKNINHVDDYDYLTDQ